MNQIPTILALVASEYLMSVKTLTEEKQTKNIREARYTAYFLLHLIPLSTRDIAKIFYSKSHYSVQRGLDYKKKLNAKSSSGIRFIERLNLIQSKIVSIEKPLIAAILT